MHFFPSPYLFIYLFGERIDFWKIYERFVGILTVGRVLTIQIGRNALFLFGISPRKRRTKFIYMKSDCLNMDAAKLKCESITDRTIDLVPPVTDTSTTNTSKNKLCNQSCQPSNNLCSRCFPTKNSGRHFGYSRVRTTPDIIITKK